MTKLTNNEIANIEASYAPEKVVTTAPSIKTVIRNGRVYNETGEVGVIYSPGFGAGWSTWSYEHKEAMLYCPELVTALLEGVSIEEVKEIIIRHFGKRALIGAIDGGMPTKVELEVAWIPAGALFRIDEYDGAEGVVLFREEDFYKA